MKFWHVGVITANINEAIRSLSGASEYEESSWEIFDVDFPDNEMKTGAGGKLRAAFGHVGGVPFEILQPLDNASYHAQQLETRGAGLHHCAYICEDDYQETVSGLVAAGGSVVWAAKHGKERPCYIETNGMVLEIINCSPFAQE